MMDDSNRSSSAAQRNSSNANEHTKQRKRKERRTRLSLIKCCCWIGIWLFMFYYIAAQILLAVGCSVPRGRHEEESSAARPFECGASAFATLLTTTAEQYKILSSRKKENAESATNTSLSILMRAVQDVHRPVLDAGEPLDLVRESQRCERYGWTLRNTTAQQQLHRRRIFAGSLLADDSWHALGANALESFGIYEIVVFVESNRTQSFQPRPWRFVDTGTGKESDDARILKSGIYGPNTAVFVDAFVDEEPNEAVSGNKHGLVREQMQRQLVLERWKQQGMQPNDIGLIMDVDETASRDFLRAVQICHVPIWDDTPASQYTCRDPMIRCSAVFFEGSPKCIHHGKGDTEFRRFMSPSLVIGACIEGIGDAERYPLAPRAYVDAKGVHHGGRQNGYGMGQRRNRWHAMPNGNSLGNYPLYNGADFRQSTNGLLKWGNTAFHFHNFFVSADALRFKHRYYGHVHENAYSVPLNAMNADLNVLVKCIMGRNNTGNRWRHVERGLERLKEKGFDLPRAFELDGYVERRHAEVKRLIVRDEKQYGRADSFSGHHLYGEHMLTHPAGSQS